MATGPPQQHLQSDDGASVARVLLAEDDVLLREGLASLLERSGFEVVGQTGDSAWILPLVRELKPDLVVVDIRMPPTNTTEGLDAARDSARSSRRSASWCCRLTPRSRTRWNCWPPVSGSVTC